MVYKSIINTIDNYKFMIYIYHHLGLGDHIICNGLVRFLQKKHNQVSLFCYQHNIENVSFMYSDNENIKLIPVNSDYECKTFIRVNNLNTNNLYKIGFSELSKYLPSIKFDEAFYKIAGIDFESRFNEFYIPRNRKKELEVYKELNPNDEPYIFLHEDQTRGLHINRSKIPSNIKIIENNIKYNIFDLLTVFENAHEIHLMQSSIKDLINSYKMDKPKIFLHNYVRNYAEDLNSIGLNKIYEIN